MNKDFFNLLGRLNKAGVDFVIIGGFAGVVYGCTYVTQDIDICCDFSYENLLKLQCAISDLNPVHRMTPNKKPLVLNDEICKNFKNLYLNTDFGQLDCLSYVNGVGDFGKVEQNSRKIEVDSLIFNVLTIDALIEAKSSLNRPHDRLAIEQLKKLKDI